MLFLFFFFKQKTAYEMRISDWSSDVCSSDLPVEGRAIVVPTRRGKRGNPVLFARRFFEVMGTVSGDVGARHIIGDNDELVIEVEVDDESVLTDVDTPAALAALAASPAP